ncbi:DUF1015 domain-containing protein [Thiovibrio frasassiensis]|uniref:DUF1015 domain-containing protein n=1 Tax=Thiovibrio frasassiensis TaxID=2984131 RepID=A0A9X4ME60_9BACT|nr:DUF1015 domain-containing protein [Thiovibrio frasassiensis]MDG4474648.1 DUF1015 domain-containing protein [Thiovibrio frasassiensis]
MALIAPFRALRYNPAKIQNMEEVVTPPYDVINNEAQAAFAARNPYNMIHLDLSKNVNAEQLTESRYHQAKETFAKWQEEGVLVRDNEPTIYVYHTNYGLPSGERRTRKGLLCLVQLAEFAEGIVKPHEKTFSGVTSDRLSLLDTCHAQFSPIFSLYPDAQGQIMTLLEGACSPEPLASVTDHDGCLHTIWGVTDPAVLAQVRALFTDKSLYIADGHHRYTTALQFRTLMRERLGEVAADSPYNHTMMYLCGMEDPGLSVLPTHRLVRMPEAVKLIDLMARLAQSFSIEEVMDGSRETLVTEVLSRMSENSGAATMFGLYHPQEDRCLLLTLREGVIDEALGAKQPAALRELDVVILSDLIIEGLLQLDHDRCVKEGLVDYYSDSDTGLDVAVKEGESRSDRSPLLFLMNPTLVSQVKRVADEGLVMPHKSTYFYPKLLTGLLLNKIVPQEKVPY